MRKPKGEDDSVRGILNSTSLEFCLLPLIGSDVRSIR
jgi:hypothetical protein